MALGGHDVNLQAPAIVIPPAMGMGLTILAAPSAADDPALAVDLPPLIQITRPQLQPDLAMGRCTPEANDTAFDSPAAVQSPLQLAGARRPKEAEAFAEPQFPQSIDARRLRPLAPKPLPPAPSQHAFLQELSAPATLQALVEKHVRQFHPANYLGDLPVPSSQASSSAASAAAVVPAPTRGGKVVELSPLNAARFASLRQQQQALQRRIEQHDQHRRSRTGRSPTTRSSLPGQ